MATDKWVARLEAKLDALLAANKIDMAQFDDSTTTRQATTAAPRELTAQEQAAIDNAPATPASVPPDTNATRRTTTQNAPDTSSSVPTVPAGAVGSVTVETEQPDGDVDVTTRPASEAKRSRR